MLEILKLSGDLREAVILYNRSLLSSCLGAQILRTSLQNDGLYGQVHVSTYYTHDKESGETFFDATEHNDAVDLFLVGVEGWDANLAKLVNEETIRSLTIFPISVGGAHLFYNQIKASRGNEQNNAGVSLEIVYDDHEMSLPSTVRQWCNMKGLATNGTPDAQLAVQGYQRLCEGKGSPNSKQGDESELADVYFRQCILDTVPPRSAFYENRLRAFSDQLDHFHSLMQYGFDSWVAGGIALVEKARERLKGNLLLANISNSGVVFSPNTRDESFTLGYLLRKKFPTCRAVVLYHQQSRDKQYIYRILRGCVYSGNPFTILANVRPDGRPQSMVCTELTPTVVHRIADEAMSAIAKRSRAA